MYEIPRFTRRLLKERIVLGFLFAFELGILPSGMLAQDASSNLEKLVESLSFHASFDQSEMADFAKGDKKLWCSSSMSQRSQAKPGLPVSLAIERVDDGGRFGGALFFRKVESRANDTAQTEAPYVFYRAAENFPAIRQNWSGTVSFWLLADISNGLKEGFCDPVQITSKEWDDASFFVEFEKRGKNVPFRLGVYADKQIWNPTNRPFEAIPARERPLLTVDDPPFAMDRWTHVAFTFENFNSGESNGNATLYLDGTKVGTLGDRDQFFSWDMSLAVIGLGLSYIGGIDDLAIFEVCLTDEEIQALFKLDDGVLGLMR